MTEMALQWTSGIATSSTMSNEDTNEYGQKEEACWSSFAEEISNGFAHGLGMASVSHLDLALERLEQLLVRLGTLPLLSFSLALFFKARSAPRNVFAPAPKWPNFIVKTL